MQAFTRHPHSVGETYLEHAAVASGYGATLIGAGLACLAHALCPWLFERTASRMVGQLYAHMAGRGRPLAGG